MLIRKYLDKQDRHAVVALWKGVFGYSAAHNDPSTAIDLKVKEGDGLFFVAVDGQDVLGTVMAGYDGHRGWIYSSRCAGSYKDQDAVRKTTVYRTLRRLIGPKFYPPPAAIPGHDPNVLMRRDDRPVLPVARIANEEMHLVLAEEDRLSPRVDRFGPAYAPFKIRKKIRGEGPRRVPDHCHFPR